MATSFPPSITHSSFTLRHLIPVLSSTASVTFCFTEYWTLLPFLQPSIPAKSLSQFWNSYLYLTSPGWIGFGLISAVSGSLTWQGLRGTPLGTRDSGKGAIARSLYGWGVVFALGHYVFGPPIAKIMKRIVYGPQEEAKDELRSWLRFHTARMILVDIPAMVCFIGGMIHMI